MNNAEETQRLLFDKEPPNLQTHDHNEQQYSTTISTSHSYQKNDCLEEIFLYYEKLLAMLQQECTENSIHVSQFSDAYTKLQVIVKQKLKKRAKAPLSSQESISANITLQAKQYLYRAYGKEVVAHQRTIVSEDTATAMESKMLRAFEMMGGQHTGDDAPTPSDDYAIPQQDDDAVEYYLQPKKDEKPTVARKICHYASKLFPWLTWIPEYRKSLLSNIRADVVAGLTVGTLLVPQSMAYALLAGLPPIYGLYTAFIPILLYPILATSRHLQVGPVAMISLLVQSALIRLKPETPQEAVGYAIILTFMSGIIQIILGIFRLGFLINLLSHPVVSGFTSAAAILIAMSQLKYVLGVSIPDSRQFHVLTYDLIMAVPKTHWPTVLFSVMCICVLFILKFAFLKIRGKKYTLKWVPAPLVIVVFSTLLIFIMVSAGAQVHDDTDKGYTDVYGIKVVGKIDSGNPFIPELPNFALISSTSKFFELLLIVLPLALVGFLESISVAKFASQQFKYDIDANQELIALGTSGFVSSFFRAYPNAGSLCRSAVAISSQSKSQFSAIISGMLVCITLFLLTPLFYFLPRCALSSIIITSVMSLINVHELIFTFKTKGKDCFLLVITFILTLFLSVEEGILIAVAISLALVIFRSSRPRFVLLGRRAGTTIYSSLNWSNAEQSLLQVPGVLVIRLDSDLFFANIVYFRDRIKQFIHQSKYPVHVLVLDCSSINQIDTSGILEVKDLNEFLAGQHIDLYLAQVKENVLRVLAFGGLYDKLPKSHVYVNLHEAVLQAKRAVASKSALV